MKKVNFVTKRMHFISFACLLDLIGNGNGKSRNGVSNYYRNSGRESLKKGKEFEKGKNVSTFCPLVHIEIGRAHV